MIEKIADTMYNFGIVFLVFSLVAAVAAFWAARDKEEDASRLAKEIFNKCLTFAVILWVMVWLIS